MTEYAGNEALVKDINDESLTEDALTEIVNDELSIVDLVLRLEQYETTGYSDGSRLYFDNDDIHYRSKNGAEQAIFIKEKNQLYYYWSLLGSVRAPLHIAAFFIIPTLVIVYLALFDEWFLKTAGTILPIVVASFFIIVGYLTIFSYRYVSLSDGVFRVKTGIPPFSKSRSIEITNEDALHQVFRTTEGEHGTTRTLSIYYESAKNNNYIRLYSCNYSEESVQKIHLLSDFLQTLTPAKGGVGFDAGRIPGHNIIQAISAVTFVAGIFLFILQVMD